MKLSEAEKLASELEAIFKKHGLFYRKSEDRKPELKFIEFEKVSIKVDQPGG